MGQENKVKQAKILLESLSQEEKRTLLWSLTQKKRNQLSINKFKHTQFNSIVGLILVFLSGTLPFINNIIELLPLKINDDNSFGYFPSFGMFIWYLSIGLTPLILILSFFFRVYKYSYIFPIISFLIVFFASLSNGFGFRISANAQYYIYIALTSVAIILLFKRIYNFIRKQEILDDLRMEIVDLILEDEK